MSLQTYRVTIMDGGKITARTYKGATLADIEKRVRCYIKRIKPDFSTPGVCSVLCRDDEAFNVFVIR